MDQINVKVSLRNNILLTLMHNNNIFTASELSLKSNVSCSDIGRFINLKEDFPFIKTGYSKSANKLSEYFQYLPEDLFPKDLYSLKRTKAETSINIKDLSCLPSMDNPHLNYEKKLLIEGLDHALDSIPKREKDIILMRNEGLTLEECAKLYNLTTSRIRQIEAKALRRLRNPIRTKLFKDYAETFGFNL